MLKPIKVTRYTRVWVLTKDYETKGYMMINCSKCSMSQVHLNWTKKRKPFEVLSFYQDSGSALCHPFVHGGMLMNSSNSLTWMSQHFHCNINNHEESHMSAANGNKQIHGKWVWRRGQEPAAKCISYPSHPVMENRRARMVTACCIMVILLFKTFSTSLIFTDLRLVYINNFLGSRCLRFLDIWIIFTMCTYCRFWIQFFGMWTWKE